MASGVDLSRGKHLDRHDASHLAVLRLEDLAHSALADRVDDQIGAEIELRAAVEQLLGLPDVQQPHFDQTVGELAGRSAARSRRARRPPTSARPPGPRRSVAASADRSAKAHCSNSDGSRWLTRDTLPAYLRDFRISLRMRSMNAFGLSTISHVLGAKPFHSRVLPSRPSANMMLGSVTWHSRTRLTFLGFLIVHHARHEPAVF